MSQPHTQLATLLRRAQWMLDEAAYELGGKQPPATDRHALAEALDELAAALREYSDESGELTTAENAHPAIVEAER
ncbi:hypothetical protein [Actinopolyspora halophila]|uniref:hypothetical protein n=1 Tax=Actinopolyspora halophila TaxID=1850 RepID=UPI00036CEFDA|nr:hypothetical protein [Actinopolyspora halophila]